MSKEGLNYMSEQKQLMCVECGKPVVMHSGPGHQPKRCPICRARRLAEQIKGYQKKFRITHRTQRCEYFRQRRTKTRRPDPVTTTTIYPFARRAAERIRPIVAQETATMVDKRASERFAEAISAEIDVAAMARDLLSQYHILIDRDQEEDVDGLTAALAEYLMKEKP